MKKGKLFKVRNYWGKRDKTQKRGYIVKSRREKEVLQSGDGEEEFQEMIDDMIVMATIIDELYENTRQLTMGTVSERQALKECLSGIHSCDDILKKWEIYAEPVVEHSQVPMN